MTNVKKVKKVKLIKNIKFNEISSKIEKNVKK